ncbi:membrane protein FAM174B isoform X1 [Fundulus heteroclitus]|nr:membrane protein FAM174B isoform X1 [Fundulus heteroclitus]
MLWQMVLAGKLFTSVLSVYYFGSMSVTHSLALSLIAAALWRIGGEPLTPSSATQLNSTSTSLVVLGHEGPTSENDTHSAVGSRISPLMTYLPTLKNVVIFICVTTALLITCLVVKVIRSGRKIRKTRKYDIITTPAERVEMAPLNEENDDEDDSTLFDVKYRSVPFR